MPYTPFTPEELHAFEAVVSATPDWVSWRRRPGNDGRDVLEISVGADQPTTIRLTKTGDPPTYMAAGLKGWSLIVCASFDELVATVTGATRRQRTVA